MANASVDLSVKTAAAVLGDGPNAIITPLVDTVNSQLRQETNEASKAAGELKAAAYVKEVSELPKEERDTKLAAFYKKKVIICFLVFMCFLKNPLAPPHTPSG